MSVNTRRRLDWAFLGLGLSAASLYVALSLPAVWARNQGALVPAPAQDGEVIPPDSLAAAYGSGGRPFRASSVIGSIHIPALSLNAPIVEGVEDSELRRGVGHLPGSAVAGGLGNVILAAHRDGLFRPLQTIQKGTEIAVTGSDGTYHYLVDSTVIVTPDSLDVLGIGSTPEVTLITCYPFSFVGHAPKRFIVKAHLVSAMPDAQQHGS